MTLKAPDDYDLSRDVCSYGYFLLAPNHWVPGRRELWRVLGLAGGPVVARITQGRSPGGRLSVALSRAARQGERAELERQVRRMLRLDVAPADLAGFHRRHAPSRASGRGRLFRSPTVFEDVIKTVTSCNVTWPGTVVMNRRLCEAAGPEADAEGTPGLTHAFPAPAALAACAPAFLRERCRVGYRDRRIVELARVFVSPPASLRGLEDPAAPEEELFAALLELPGIGPYAAGNIMQLSGRYGRLALDSESVRHGRDVLKMRGPASSVLRRLAARYGAFGPDAFRAYWFDLWADYERRHGPAWTWERDSTGLLFTASKLAGQGSRRGSASTMSGRGGAGTRAVERRRAATRRRRSETPNR